jgi:hypothetical protein
LPLFFRYAVMPAVRKAWFPIRVLMAGDGRAALDHAVGVLLPHRIAGECAGLPGRRAE